MYGDRSEKDLCPSGQGWSLVYRTPTSFLLRSCAFDQSWDGYAKSAIFEAGGVQQPPVALTDDRCIIPAECLKRAGINLKIGVSGIKVECGKTRLVSMASKIMYALDPTQLMPPTHMDGRCGEARSLRSSEKILLRMQRFRKSLTTHSGHHWILPEDSEAAQAIPPPTKRWRTFSMMFSAIRRKQIFLRRTYLCLSTLLSNS